MSSNKSFGGKMSEAVRAELVRAVEAGEIDNATEYSKAFAERHGLNPVSVRSAISRIRRDLGMLTRGPRSQSSATAETTGEPRERISAVTLLKGAAATDPRIARVAAAALIRYEHDEAFRHAVDEQRPEIERIYDSLSTLRKTTAELLPEEREDLARFFTTG